MTHNIDADEVSALLATRREFGPDAEPAVIAAFLDRTGQAIDTRVDQRIAQHRAAGTWAPSPPASPPNRSTLTLAIVSMLLGVPLTGVAVALHGFAALVGFLVVWAGIVIINVSYQRGSH